jgi:uncharacterized protein
MAVTDVTMVRIYLTEGEGRLAELMGLLHDRDKVRGVTVFRGISGFGRSGRVHSATLLDVSLDLPLVIEFFDTPARIAAVMAHLDQVIEPGHMVSWPAKVNAGDEGTC